jgi:putative acetyltransferase
MQIRPETPRDYAAIADINIRAFGERLNEAHIVAFQRQRSAFDPELSLVAEIDGKAVGHVLFSPVTIRLLDQDIEAVLLAPIAIDLPYQKQGIGGKLIEEGHRIAREKGCLLSFLIGHPEYYPRFGYRTGVYAGGCGITVDADTLPREYTPLEMRKPKEADIPALKALWLHEEDGVDFAIIPGASLLDWLSPDARVEATVYLREGEIVGYTRIRGTAPVIFLAKDADTARIMAAGIAGTSSEVRLPLHPYSASAAAFGQPEMKVWGAEMACPLVPGVFDEFYAKVQAGERLPGRVIWTTAFEG